MGSGKSTIGRPLAKESNRYFLDTDALIENFENKSIDSIFKTKGESYFRELEKKTFNWLSNVNSAVISTGGGMPLYIDDLKKVGKVFYLRVSFEKILKRLNQNEITKRPLFQNIDKAKELYYKRDEIYLQKADVTIEADGKINDIIFQILNKL